MNKYAIDQIVNFIVRENGEEFKILGKIVDFHETPNGYTYDLYSVNSDGCYDDIPEADILG